MTAHAAHLTEHAALLLDALPALGAEPEHEVWLVRVETMLTRIDAAFDDKRLATPLRTVRGTIVDIADTS